MDQIIPRWEFRIFSPHPHAAEEILRAQTSQGGREGDEIYLLSRESGENVKIRADRLDIKLLLETDDTGLERWTPRLDTAFPLEPAALAVLQDALAVKISIRARGPCALRPLLDAARMNSRLRVVRIHKHRRAFELLGARAELAELQLESVELRSIAVEHEDPARVRAAIAHLGLEREPNTSYIRALKRAVGMESAA